jgi:hypothetical protein
MADVTELRSRIIKVGVDARNRASKEILDKLRTNARFHQVTGAMLRATKVTNFDRGTQYGFVAESDVEWAKYVDEGTNPHVITPRSPGGVLVFYWPKVGRVVYTKRVNHPGNIAFRWFSQPISEFREIIQKAVTEASAR